MKNFAIKRTGIRIPTYLDEKIKKLAKQDGISKNALILGILKNHVEYEEEKNKQGKEENRDGN